MNANPASVVHVVDGDPAVRDSLTTLLGLNGFEATAYATGAAYLNRGPGHRDGGEWVVCEADLPDGSGLDLFARIRAADADTPFILLVSHRDRGIVESARRAGIERVFQKPLVHRNLLEYIRSRSQREDGK